MKNLTYITIIVSILFFLSLGLNVVLSKNPVYSIFYLILFFITGSCLIALFGYDYLALIFVLVYVGAIAVLFLFVIMILDIKLINKSRVIKQSKNFNLLFYGIGLLLIFCLLSPHLRSIQLLLMLISYLLSFLLYVFWPIFDLFNIAVNLNDPILRPEILENTLFVLYDVELQFYLCSVASPNYITNVERFYCFLALASKLCLCSFKFFYSFDDYCSFWIFTDFGINFQKGVFRIVAPVDYFPIIIEYFPPIIKKLVSNSPLYHDHKARFPFESYRHFFYDNSMWVDYDSSIKNLQVLYTDFSALFILCGGILLIAMISCISLAFPPRSELKSTKKRRHRYDK